MVTYIEYRIFFIFVGLNFISLLLSQIDFMYYVNTDLLIAFQCDRKVSHRYHFDSIWNPKSTRERKKNVKENYFFMFGGGFKVKNIKSNQM